MSVYPPPLSQVPIFNPNDFTETVTSVIGGGSTTPSGVYLEYPTAQGPETFVGSSGDNELVIGAGSISIGYDKLTVPKGVAFSGLGFAYDNGTTVSSTTWANLQTKVQAVSALAPAQDATTLNINDAICIQNGETSTATNTIIISASAGDNQILLNDSAGTSGYVLTSGGADGSITWASASVPTPDLATVIGVYPSGVANLNQTITMSNDFGVHNAGIILNGNGGIFVQDLDVLTDSCTQTYQGFEINSSVNSLGTTIANSISLTSSANEFPTLFMSNRANEVLQQQLILASDQLQINHPAVQRETQLTNSNLQFDDTYNNHTFIAGLSQGVITYGTPLEIQGETIQIGLNPSYSNTVDIGWKNPSTALNSQINIAGQAEFTNLTPHCSIDPTFGNDLTNKGYVDRVVGNYSGNGVALYFNIPSANPNPITTYPVSANLQPTLIAVNATPSANYYTLTTPALGTDTLLASFTTDVGYPNLTTIPAGLWSMLVYGYASGSGGSLFYHFHLVEVNSAGTVIATIGTSGFSSDVNATSSVDPDAYHASLALVAPYTLASTSSRIRVNIYSTGTGMGGSVNLNTLFGGLYYSFITTTLSATTALLSTNNTWTGTNNFGTGLLSSQTLTAPTVNSPVSLYTAQTSGGDLTIGASAVDTTISGTLKATTPLTNTNNTVVPTTAWVNTFFALASSLSAYGALAVANTWTLLQTFTTGINTYSITGAVASTAVSLFNTTTGTITMGSSSSTNRIGNLQISSFGLNPTTATNSMYVGGAQFVVGAELGLGASVGRAGPVNVGTGQSAGATTSIGNAVNTNKIGSFQMIGNTIDNQTATSAINFGDSQTTGAMTIGTLAGRTGAIGIGASTCDVNVNGVLKTTTPATNINTTQVPTTAWVNTFYQTLAGMSAYLTTATASTTYQTLADMTNYLTTATASTTYQTLAGMSAYLTTTTASSTYATIASLAGYGAKATTNTWDLLQTFTTGISTYSITGAVAGTAVKLFDTTTGVIDFGAGGQINVGNYRFSGGSLGRGSAGGGISFGDTQTTGTMDLGTNAGRSGAIAIGANSCAINVGGVLNANQGIVLSADKRITFSTNTANPTATSTILGSVYTGTYTGGVTVLSNGVDFSVSEITSVPIGVYIATGTTNLSSSNASTLITQPRIQIKNSTNGTYWASGGVPSYTTTAANERTALTCTGVLVVGAVSTIQLILNASSAGNVRCGSDSNNTFQFRLVRIG